MPAAIEITKVKISANAREIHYKRFLPGGTEHCQLVIERSNIAILQEKMEPLLGEAIDIIGLDPDRWDGAEVIGVSFKDTDDGTGVTISLLNKEELAVCCNTPYLKPEDQGVTLSKAISELMTTAIKFVQEQPKQLELEVAA